MTKSDVLPRDKKIIYSAFKEALCCENSGVEWNNFDELKQAGFFAILEHNVEDAVDLLEMDNDEADAAKDAINEIVGKLCPNVVRKTLHSGRDSWGVYYDMDIHQFEDGSINTYIRENETDFDSEVWENAENLKKYLLGEGEPEDSQVFKWLAGDDSAAVEE